ncbi:hypothetical protein ACS0TY_008083 [Phlomoides rotata]
MLLAFFCTFLWFQVVSAEHSARELDSLLQDYAFRAFVRPKTGIIYDGNVPSNLTGLQVAALRLRTGSLRRRGVSNFKEFRFPIGVDAQPHVKRLVFVYHNLGNCSSLYYPLPGYTFLAPILGFLAYDAYDLSATNLSELDVRATGDPISVTFSGFGPEQSSPMCVHFGSDGSVGFDNVVNGSTCLTTNQGHFSIVTESLVSPAPAPEPEPIGGGGGNAGGKGRRRRGWVIAGAVVGGAALLVVLGMVFAYVRRCRRRKKIRRMDDAAELGVALPMTSVGNTKAPVALETRTRPFLENEFVP